MEVKTSIKTVGAVRRINREKLLKALAHIYVGIIDIYKDDAVGDAIVKEFMTPIIKAYNVNHNKPIFYDDVIEKIPEMAS